MIAIQGKFNGDLSTAGAGPLVASSLAYAGALATVLLFLAGTGQLRASLSTIRSTGALWWFAIGLCSVPIVVSMAVGIPVIGVALASVCAVAGQTVSGLVLDARGIGVDAPIRLTARRGVAGLCALLGLVIAVLTGPGPSTQTVLSAVIMGVFLFVGGLLLSVQTAGNGVVAAQTGNPLIPVVTSVAGGLIGVSLLTGAIALTGNLGEVALPSVTGQWWLYLGGPLGMVIATAAAFAVTRLGTFALTIAIVGGQLVTAVALDIFGSVGASWSTALSLAIIAISVTLTVLPTRTQQTDPATEPDPLELVRS